MSTPGPDDPKGTLLVIAVTLVLVVLLLAVGSQLTHF